MESQDQYRHPRRPDYEPRLWAQFDNTNFPRQENGENPQIKGTPANKQMANIETTTGIRPTYRSQPIRNESGQNKNDRQNEKGRNSTYMYRRILDLTYFNSTPIYQKHPKLERI